jgi:hypothetical protein
MKKTIKTGVLTIKTGLKILLITSIIGKLETINWDKFIKNDMLILNKNTKI